MYRNSAYPFLVTSDDNKSIHNSELLVRLCTVHEFKCPSSIAQGMSENGNIIMNLNKYIFPYNIV
jgi:hypothetical protein